MGVTVNIYATSNVSFEAINNVDQALSSELDSQVNFGVYTSLRDISMAPTQVQCSDKYWTAQNFEDYCYFSGHLTDDEHFILLSDCNYGGVAYYGVGKNSNQDYDMAYGISTAGTNTSAEFYQNIAIQEVAHTLMDDASGSCPDSTANEHSCGRIDAYGRSSPMMTSYEDKNWDICEEFPWYGSHTMITPDCTRNRLESYVDMYNLA